MDVSDRLVSFLNQTVTPGWDDSGSAALTAPHFDHTTFEFRGAAYRRDGSLIVQSLRPSRLGHWRPIDPVSIGTEEIAKLTKHESAIYGGHFLNVWGHVLFETLSTAYAAKHMPAIPVIFTPFAPGADYSEFRAAWERAKPIISAAGWGDRPLILQDGPMRFDRLIVPERASVYAAPVGTRLMLEEMGEVYETIRLNIAPQVQSTRVVVAARPSWTGRKHPAEDEFYKMMTDRGALLINGVDTLPLDQVTAFAQASAVVGFAGSNLHNSVFAHRGIKVFEIGDERSYGAGNGDYRNWTQVAMCSVLGQSLTFVESFSKIKDCLKPLTATDICNAIYFEL